MTLFEAIFGFELPSSKSLTLADGLEIQRQCMIAEWKAQQYEMTRNIHTPIFKTDCSADLGPKQLQWCREHLGNFAKYEQQVIASKGDVETHRHD